MTTASLRKVVPESDASRTFSEALAALSEEPKRLPCKLFYDAEGSRLFEQITRLPEYYLARTEISILERYGQEIAERIGPGVVLVEFGSGASQKTRLLLDKLVKPRVYVPIDICREMLHLSAKALEKAYPALAVRPVVGDFTHEVELPLSDNERQRPTTAFFPGSTIGNFEHDAAVSFLRRVRRLSRRGAQLLIGVDLPKQTTALESAYDDAEGVTARFNLNALTVLNREHGTRFRLEDFRHRALWNASKSRIEMHLVCQRDHSVWLGTQRFSFRAGEPIVTEHCYKYTLEDFCDLATGAGYRVARVWLDDDRAFSVQLLTPATK